LSVLPENLASIRMFERLGFRIDANPRGTAVRGRPVRPVAPLNDPSLPIWYGCTPSSIGVIRLDEGNPFDLPRTLLSPRRPGMGRRAASVTMAVTNSRPKADTLRDADPRDGGAKPKVGR